MESSENEEKFLNDLQCQQETFAYEIILMLKNSYRLHESEPYPKKFLFANDEICDAVCAISYVFRCHYRQVYYYLHNELNNPEEYEKYCLSLPVARSKRYSFNFLFRVSFIFEMTMYFCKEGCDYFNIARKCLAKYPDLLYFHASGGWIRLSEISAYILCVTKICEVDITVEHPLLGTFIETAQCNAPNLLPKALFHMNYLLQESIEITHMIETGLEDEFFNPKDLQTLTVLHKHFVASQTPKHIYKTEDLIKFHETFPLSNRCRFEIVKESDIHYYIIYDLYVEKKEIIYYLRSYMDPNILERFFPLKPSPDSPDEVEENLGYYPECVTCNFSREETLDKLDSHKESLSHGCNKKVEYSHASNEENLTDIPEYFDSDAYDNMKRLGNLDEETFKDLDENFHDSENIDGCIQSSNEDIPMSNIPDMPREKKLDLIKLIIDITRMPIERKEVLIYSLPTNPCLKYFDKSLLMSICVSVQHSPNKETSELKDILKNISYISTATKYLLFRITKNCSGLTTKERNELFQVLINIPDNIVAEKAKIVQIINNMNSCSEQIKSHLIQCVIDLTDEECDELHRSCDVKTENSFEGISQNVNEVSEEFEQFQILCKNESKFTQWLDQETFQIPQSIYTNTKEVDNENVHDSEGIDIAGLPQSSNKDIPMSNIRDMPRDKKLQLIKLIKDIDQMPIERKKFLMYSLPTIQCLQWFDQFLLKYICASVPHSPHKEFSPSELKDSLKKISYIPKTTKYVLSKVIRKCSEFTNEERNELFQLLKNIPDNIVAKKANVVQIINNMDRCSDQIKSHLIQCVIDLTDEECGELYRSPGVKTVNSFEEIFQNINEVSKEFEQFQMFCKNESKLHGLDVPLITTKLSKKVREESQDEKQFDSTSSMPKICQKNSETQNYFKFSEMDNIADGDIDVKEAKSLDNCCRKSEVPNPPPNRQRCKPNKKSKKRSKK